MKHFRVRSSNLVSVGWSPNDEGEPEGDGKLQVQFHGESLYEYDDVPHWIFAKMMEISEGDESLGSWFYYHVKKVWDVGRYRKLPFDEPEYGTYGEE